MGTDIRSGQGSNHLAVRRRRLIVRLLFLVLVLLAFMAAMPAFHAVSGFDVPDAFDHGISARSALSVGIIMAYSTLIALLLFSVGGIPVAGRLRESRASRSHVTQTYRSYTRRPRGFSVRRADRECDGDEPASSAGRRIGGP